MLRAEIKKARQDAELASKIDTNILIEELTKDKHNHLENKTTASIMTEMLNVLNLYELNANEFMPKLIGYRYAGELNDIYLGQHIRWIRTDVNPPTMTNGGIYLGPLFKDNGTFLQVKLYGKSIANVSLNTCIVFQKLSFGENVVLYASDIVNGDK